MKPKVYNAALTILSTITFAAADNGHETEYLQATGCIPETNELNKKRSSSRSAVGFCYAYFHIFVPTIRAVTNIDILNKTYIRARIV